MIAASLRSCSLSSSSSSLTKLVEASDESAGMTVELNSETELPCNWEQCLDLRTGELYYVNCETGTKTTNDPRRAINNGDNTAISSVCDSSNQYTNEANTSSNDDDGSIAVVATAAEYTTDSEDIADSSTISSSSSSSSPRTDEGSEKILVVAGCKACFMYFMVPKYDGSCPKCRADLLHLGNVGFL